MTQNPVSVHQVVCWALRGPVPLDITTGCPMEVDHFNRNKRDNRIANLDYVCWLQQVMNKDWIAAACYRFKLAWLAYKRQGMPMPVPLPAPSQYL